MFVYGVLVYAQKNFTGIDPEKLYRATFIASTAYDVASYGPRFCSTVL